MASDELVSRLRNVAVWLSSDSPAHNSTASTVAGEAADEIERLWAAADYDSAAGLEEAAEAAWNVHEHDYWGYPAPMEWTEIREEARVLWRNIAAAARKPEGTT